MFTRAVDRMNTDADRVETERRTKLYYEQLKKEQEEEAAKIVPPPGDELPAIAVGSDNPIKPITPEHRGIPVAEIDGRFVVRAQHLEIPVNRIEVPFYDVRKDYELKQRTYEVTRMAYEVKKDIPFRQDKGIKTSE